TKPFGKIKAAAILITGSGAQDRDSTILGHKPFAVIADHLTKQGYAVLRLDDRGVGGSTGNPMTATSADFAEDINAAIDFLKQQTDIPRNKIGLIGHSEGGMIAPMVAAQRKDIAFMILLAGPGVKATELMIQQRFDIYAQAGIPRDRLIQSKAIDRQLYNAINALSSDQPFDQEITKLIEKSIRILDIGNEEERAIQANALKAQYSLPWFRYFFRYDPEEYLSKTKLPVLAVNGSLDIQIESKANLKGLEQLFKKYQYPDFEIVELDKLNHLFQKTETGSVDEYGLLRETFANNALMLMSNWLDKRFYAE
ncbi:MAG: alpha/beta fold hydrolase, partial [Kangiellaceae bacterium]|nr:alpha/beta fold hydrolase [Kangiellaceae bacterium]